MPTTVIKTIGPTGDYADFNAAQAAITAAGGSMVALDQIWRLRVQGGAEQIFTSIQKIDTVTFDATRYVVIEPVPGTGFNENGSKLTNAIAYNAANGAACRSTAADTSQWAFYFSGVSIVQGMQFKRDTQGNALRVATGTGFGVIQNCIIRYNQSAYEPAIQVGTLVVNTAVQVDLVQTNDPAVFSNRFASGTVIDSVTVMAQPGSATNGTLCDGSSSGPTVKNTAFFGLQRAAVNITPTFSNCSTDLSTLAGTANLTSQVAANQFVSTTTDLRVKAGAGLIGAGTRSATNTGDLDIVGASRSTTTPTIGAREYTSGTTAVTSDLTASFTISSSLTSVQSDMAASFQLQSAVINSLAATFTILANASVTVPIVNNTNTVQAAVTIPHVVVNRLSDRTQLLSLASQTTDGSGNLQITGLTAGTAVVVNGWNADGSWGFVWSGTAA